MANHSSAPLNKGYFISVLVLTFVLPLLCAVAETFINKEAQLSFALLGKWFIFSAAGLRLFIAGIRQVTNPGFTVKQIFGVENPESFPVMREVGFGNLCFGATAVVSLFMPQWRVVAAFACGLYYGLAGTLHLAQKLSNANETFAMVTDLLVFVLLAVYFVAAI